MVGSEGLVSPRQHGVTKPLSLMGPTEADLLRTKKLNKFLVDAGLYESEEEGAKREVVLGRIKQDSHYETGLPVADTEKMTMTSVIQQFNSQSYTLMEQCVIEKKEEHSTAMNAFELISMSFLKSECQSQLLSAIGRGTYGEMETQV
ncbi:Nucleotidyltransferase, class I, C-terminal-like protein [Artemisia annua]|uniref:Nucleotidyltransferase, class I, C-terminal-like protein n=1 Tax=Artemisia annua TaxID=35608 RepID=A0A2U1MR20_ARTAN|nr:Nucleotidyltransferase, class I, C-terminal-like protein [Artemisia annua]